MESQGTFVLRPNGPYNFELSYSFYRRSRFEMIDRFADRYFARPFLFEGRPVLIKIPRREPGLVERLRIDWFSPVRNIDGKKLRRLLTRMFYIDFDIGQFYRLRNDPVMRRLIKRFAGFRPILTPNVFEAAAWAIIGQQVTLQFAYLLKSRLIKMIHRTFEVDGERYFLFPGPEDIAQLDHQSLRSIQLSGRKTEYLLHLSHLVASGELDLENVMALDYETAYQKLIAVRGIGPWTANYVLLRGAGHRDAFPIGDSGINRAVREQYGLNAKRNLHSLLKLGEQWRPYRSLATFYLWKSL